MKFFRACPNCNKFFYDYEKFKSHNCMEVTPEEEKLKKHFEEIAAANSSEDVETKINTYIPPDAKRVEQQQRNDLKKKYISFLKEKGIDMSTERSFRKIEEAYKSNGGE